MSTQQPNNNRIEPSINSTSAMPQEGNKTPREVTALYQTLGVAPDASADDLKAAQTKAVYDSSLKDDERDKIKNAYAEITAYREKLAEEEAERKRAEAAPPTAEKLPEKKPNRFKITPKRLGALVVAAAAAVGTSYIISQPSEEEIRQANLEKRKAAADFNRIGAYVALEVSDQIAANPAKFLGPQHNASEAIGLRNIVLRAQKGISEAEKGNMAYKNNGQYLTPNAPSSWGPSRTANVLFDSKTDELKIEVYGADGKLQKETTVGVAKQIELAKQNAAYSSGQVSKPN